MNINDLIAIVKKKLKNKIIIEEISIEDKSRFFIKNIRHIKKENII